MSLNKDSFTIEGALNLGVNLINLQYFGFPESEILGSSKITGPVLEHFKNDLSTSCTDFGVNSKVIKEQNTSTEVFVFLSLSPKSLLT